MQQLKIVYFLKGLQQYDSLAVQIKTVNNSNVIIKFPNKNSFSCGDYYDSTSQYKKNDRQEIIYFQVKPRFLNIGK